MESVIQDLRYCSRMLLRKPGFTLVAIVTLALGIGANSAIFSITDKLLIRSLPVREPDRLVFINSVSVSPHFVSNAFSYPDFEDYRSKNTVLNGLLAFTLTQLELTTNDQIERVNAEYVSANYFEVLGVTTARGRAFSLDEDKTKESQAVAVISEGFWRSRLGADPNAIGQTITLNNSP